MVRYGVAYSSCDGLFQPSPMTLVAALGTASARNNPSMRIVTQFITKTKFI